MAIMKTRQEVETQLNKQIKRLTKNPTLIIREWDKGIGLFRYIQSYAFESYWESLPSAYCGCPTMIKYGEYDADGSQELTETIRAMPLPCGCRDIQVHHLPMFKRAQLEAYDYYKRIY